MKKILILVVGILIGTAAFAQENNNQNKTYLEQAFQVLNISGGYSDTPVYYWIMSKQVTDDSQVTEGLTTGDMLKK